MKRAVFLDRDGTINTEKNYLYRIEDWEWISGALEAIRGFNKIGFVVIVVTNQAGIARGIYSYQDVEKLHRFVKNSAQQEGALIDGFYYCPHHPSYGQKIQCECRKPRPGMLLKAREHYDIELESSYIIGDKVSDVMAGVSLGVKPILVLTGYGKSEICNLDCKIRIAQDLYEAYQFIKSETHSK